MKASYTVKLATILCMVLLTIAVLVAWNSPATGYESSIYRATPSLVWGCLIFSIICGSAIIVHQVYRKDEYSKTWVAGFVIIIASNTVILLMHIIRGYAMWGASSDAGTHLGIIQDLTLTGSYSYGKLFEPLTHVLFTQLSQILDISPITLIKLMPVFFSVMYMVFMYFLAKSILRNRQQVLLAILAATALIFARSISMTPNILADLFFPMTLYLLFRSYRPGTWPWRAMFIIMLLLFPVFHEVPTVALVIFLIAIPATNLFIAKLALNKDKLIDGGFRFNMVSLLILFAGIGIWLGPKLVSTAGTISPEEYLFTPEQLAGPLIPSQLPEDASHLTVLSTSISYASYYGYSVAAQFFKLYGGTLAYILLALSAFPVLWGAVRNRMDYRNLLSLYGPMIIIALLIIALLFSAVHFSPMRFLFFLLIICSIFAGFMLHQIIEWASVYRRKWLARTAICAVAVLLIAVFVNSIFTVYPSPYTLAHSYQTTQSEIGGMDWFLHNKDTAIYSSGWNYHPRRYAAFLLTPEERAGRTDFSDEATYNLPFHLGYDKHSLMGQSYEDDTYVVLRELNRRTYVDVYPRMAELRLLPGDFAKMENDPSVNKLYDNSGMDVWYVRAQG